jgi:hypothetical protein
LCEGPKPVAATAIGIGFSASMAQLRRGLHVFGTPLRRAWRFCKEKTFREEAMLKTVRAIGAVALLLVVNGVSAHTPSQPPHQLYNEGDLKLESGEVIKDFSISYVTHGTLNAKKSNAILMVTAISGNHHRLDFMIGPGKALDPDKYFIVATDAISNGLSTSPSNSTGQARMSFPKFTIRDMVESQYRGMAAATRQCRKKASGCGAIFSTFWRREPPTCIRRSSRTASTCCRG